MGFEPGSFPCEKIIFEIIQLCCTAYSAKETQFCVKQERLLQGIGKKKTIPASEQPIRHGRNMELLSNQEILMKHEIMRENMEEERTISIRNIRQLPKIMLTKIHDVLRSRMKKERNNCISEGLMDNLANCEYILSKNNCFFNSIIQIINGRLFTIHQSKCMIGHHHSDFYLDYIVCQERNTDIECHCGHYTNVVQPIRCLAEQTVITFIIPLSLSNISVDSFGNVLKKNVLMSGSIWNFDEFLVRKLLSDVNLKGIWMCDFSQKLLHSNVDIYSVITCIKHIQFSSAMNGQFIHVYSNRKMAYSLSFIDCLADKPDNQILPKHLRFGQKQKYCVVTDHKDTLMKVAEMVVFIVIIWRCLEIIKKVEDVSDSKYTITHDDTSSELLEHKGQTKMLSCFLNSRESGNVPVGQVRDSRTNQSNHITGEKTSLCTNIPHVTQSGRASRHGVISQDNILLQSNMTNRNPPLQMHMPGNDDNNTNNISRNLPQVSPRQQQTCERRTGERPTFFNYHSYAFHINDLLCPNGVTGVPNPDGSSIHSQFGPVQHLRYSGVPVRISSYINSPRYMSQMPPDMAGSIWNFHEFLVEKLLSDVNLKGIWMCDLSQKLLHSDVDIYSVITCIKHIQFSSAMSGQLKHEYGNRKMAYSLSFIDCLADKPDNQILPKHLRFGKKQKYYVVTDHKDALMKVAEMAVFIVIIWCCLKIIKKVEDVSDSKYTITQDDTSSEILEHKGQTKMLSYFSQSKPYHQILVALICCVQTLKCTLAQVSFGYQINKRNILDRWTKMIISMKTFFWQRHKILRLSKDLMTTSKCVEHKDVIKNLLDFTHVMEQRMICYPFMGNLDELFIKMTQDEIPTVNDTMAFEMIRLCSLKTFPTSSGQSLLRLAQAGFYYKGERDKLICFSCGIECEGWWPGEDPVGVHRQRSPNCLFLNSQESGNVPVGQVRDSQTNQSNHINGETLLCTNIPQVTQSGRASQHSVISQDNILLQGNMTDQNPPLLMHMPGNDDNNTNNISRNLPQVNPRQQQISERRIEQPAVFDHYSNSCHRNNLLCPNGVTGVPNPDGSGIHSQFGPVKHLRYSGVPVRISSYVNWPRYLSQTPQDMAVAGFFFAGFTDSIRCFCCGISLRNWQTEDNPWVEHARYSPRCRYLLMCKGEDFVQLVQIAAQELLNESDAIVTQTTRRQGSNRKAITPTELGIETHNSGAGKDGVEDPFETEAVQSVMEMGYSQNIIHKAIGKLVKKMGWSGLSAVALMEIILEDEENNSTAGHSDEEGAAGGLPSNPTAAAIPIDVLKEQNRELQENKLCKICFSEPLNIVFLPCAHLCCCVQCAQSMKKCPICRKVIKGSVRIHMASSSVNGINE